MGLAAAKGIAVKFGEGRGLWQQIKRVALTDVGVLVRGIQYDTLEDLERVLLEADFAGAAFELVEELEAAIRRGGLKSEDQVRGWLIERIAGMLESGPPVKDLQLGDGKGPAVMLMLGVNGVGKTTQAAKLGARLRAQGRSILFAAADTFRAGASEQLKVWADRLDAPCVMGTKGGDPAAVAFDAIEAAQARGVDVVIIDTAGRLHTQTDLMAELQKIVRVIERKREGAPHESLLVLDGTVGQNALQQGKLFAASVPVTGLVVTKLDGTAKGGAVVMLQRELGVPIRFVGMGEGLDDLELFDPRAFAERLIGG
jgi:fused signal recognition particle receptor